jgi:translation initiation factor IF-2
VVTGNKIRIYDLARDHTPEDLDEKFRKKIQAEITRRTIKTATDLGQNAKTASSSIDSDLVEKILQTINIPEIIGEITDRTAKPVKNTVPKAAHLEAPKEEEAPKKKLKIVRRIGLARPDEAPAELKEQSEVPAVLGEVPAEEKSSLIETAPAEEVEEDNKVYEDDVKGMMGLMQSPSAVPSKKQHVSLDINKVKSIPLRPSSVGQPYRVAKPTAISQGMGRKKRRGAVEDKPKKQKIKVEETLDNELKEITITKPMTVRELAQTINVAETSIITYFFMRKIIKTVNDMLEKDLIVQYLESQNYLVNTQEQEAIEHAELKTTLAEDESEGNLISRPPVVTIMGHVDHGKTTLLDKIRQAKTKVVDQESGGITQHINAYKIETLDYDKNVRKITFVDTPGHEAFTAMRRRGANFTDIVVLLVAADDGVMPQTLECIKHIKAAKVPFLVAVNKIDKPGANPDKALGQLAEHDILVEQYGGKVVCSMISALTGKNIDDLLEKIILVADAELADKIRSNPNRPAVGTVIEAELSRAKGPLATVLVQNGTLKIGDFVAAGAVYGRVKALFDENHLALDAAGPSTPVKVLGFSGVPKAGDTLKAYTNIQEAKDAADEVARQELEAKRFRGLSAFASEIKEGQVKELNIIIKADVQGSAEAIAHEINKLSTEEILVKPIVIETGSITSNDVDLAERTGAVIVGFHVGTDSNTAKLADKLDVRIKSYEVIYKLTEDLERAVLGMHEPEREEVKLGSLEVRKIFVIDKRTIAGSFVTGGKIVRNEIARVIRDGVQIYEGKVDYLRRFKDDAKEVKEGFECGLSFEKYNDLVEGDIIECWTVKEIARARL